MRVKVLKYRGVLARQSGAHRVITIAARARDVFAFASIARAGRDPGESLRGFQRPQIAAHIREIRDYLDAPDAVLPNSIAVGFVEGAELRELGHGMAELTIDTSGAPRGYVIDGQQRLTALSGLDKDFELFVSVLICRDVKELRRQFMLLNRTRPLPKALMYELLPGTTGLPGRLASRGFAAELTERLNFDRASSLRGKIYLYTNPSGVIRDTAIQKVILYSITHGAIREMPERKRSSEGFKLLSHFFTGVRAVFPDEWDGHTPKTSRLLHGTGIQALGFVMEFLRGNSGVMSAKQFAAGLAPLKGRTAWTSGTWVFSDAERVPWNKLENTHRQIAALAQHLVTIVRSETERKFRLEPTPGQDTP